MTSASDAERVDLKDLSVQLDPARDTPLWREALLYRLASSEFDGSPTEATTMADLLTHSSPPADWPPEDASWLALRFLQHYDPLDASANNSRQFAFASALLVSAVERNSDQGRAYKVYLDLNDIARNSSNTEWASRLLDRLADAGPGGAFQNLQLERAWELCG